MQAIAEPVTQPLSPAAALSANAGLGSTAASSADRVIWVDHLKGFGIIAVVVGHALGGMIDGGLVTGPDWFRPLFAFIYVWHMPLFFFLSGLFVSGRIVRDKNRFLSSLPRSIIWPYMLWSVVQVSLIWAAGSLVNSPSEGLGIALLQILYLPPSQFWFLYGLLFMHGAALIAGRYAGKAGFLVAMLIAASLAQLAFMPPVAEAIMRMAPYYGLGVVLGAGLLAGSIPRNWSAGHWAAIIAAPLAIALSLWDALAKGDPQHWPASSSGIVAAVNGFQNFFAATLVLTALVLIAARCAPHLPRWLARCGQLSMPIFLLHIIVMAGLRIMVVRVFGPLESGLLLLLLCAAGIIGPIIAYQIAHFAGIERKLGFA